MSKIETAKSSPLADVVEFQTSGIEDIKVRKNSPNCNCGQNCNHCSGNCGNCNSCSNCNGGNCRR